jgi:hypothetical protein
MTWKAGMELDAVTEALDRTQTIRFALDTLEGNLAGDLMSDNLGSELNALRKRLTEMERRALGMVGHRNYMILAPKSCVEEFGDEAIAAVRTLDDLGLVIPLYDWVPA